MIKKTFKTLKFILLSSLILSCGPALSPDEASLIARGKGRLIVPFSNKTPASQSFNTKTIPAGTKSISVKLTGALLPEPQQRIINTAEPTTVVFEDLSPGNYALTGEAFNQLDAVGTPLATKVLNVVVQAGNNTVALGLEVKLEGVVKLTMLR